MVSIVRDGSKYGKPPACIDFKLVYCYISQLLPFDHKSGRSFVLLAYIPNQSVYMLVLLIPTCRDQLSFTATKPTGFIQRERCILPLKLDGLPLDGSDSEQTLKTS